MRLSLFLLAVIGCAGTPRQAPPAPAPEPDPVVVVPYDISASTVNGVPLADGYPLQMPTADDAAAAAIKKLLPAFEVLSVEATPLRLMIVMRGRKWGTELVSDQILNPPDAKVHPLTELDDFTRTMAPWCGSPVRWAASTLHREVSQIEVNREGATSAATGYSIVRVQALRPSTANEPVSYWYFTCSVSPGERLQRAITAWSPEMVTRALANPAFAVHERVTTLEGVIDDDAGCGEWQRRGQPCDPVYVPDNFYVRTPGTTITRDRFATPPELANYRFGLVYGLQRTCDHRYRLTISLAVQMPTYNTLVKRPDGHATRTSYELSVDNAVLDAITGERLSADGPHCDL